MTGSRILLLLFLILSVFAGQAATRTLIIRTPKAVDVQEKSSPDDAVLTELISLERLLFVAQQNGDRPALERLLAEDFTWKDVGNNRKLNRAQFLAQVKIDHSIKDLECRDHRLKFDGTTAVLSGECRYELHGEHLRERFTDHWIKKDGEWLIVSGETIVSRNIR